MAKRLYTTRCKAKGKWHVREACDFFPVTEFFAGSGLVTEALKDSFNVIWANDICPRKASVYEANHGKDHFHLGSIHTVRGAELPHAAMSWASFPCQDLSLAGKIVGIHSERSGLVWEWLRVLDECSNPPPVLVAENVVGLVSSHEGQNYLRLHEALSARGYAVGAVMLDAVHWVPQSRPRVFVIAISHQVVIPDTLRQLVPGWCHPDAIQSVAAKCQGDWVWWRIPKPQRRFKGLSDILEWDAPVDDATRRDRLLGMISPAHKKTLYDLALTGQAVFPGYKRTRNGRQTLEIRFDNIAGCLRTPEGGSSRQNVILRDSKGAIKTRLLTVRETARLMGAPESYQLPGSYNDGYKAMGDAVAVPVVRWLARNLLEPLCRAAMRKDNYYAVAQ